MYEALILLGRSLDLSISDYAEAVRSFYDGNSGEIPDLDIDDDRLRVTFEGIVFSVVRNCQPQVLAESEEIAELTRPRDRAGLAEARCRLEVSSTADAGRLYFNDFLFLIEAAQSFGKVWAFDPSTSKLM